MLSWKQTRKSGTDFEIELFNLINTFSKYIWRNVRVETLLTQSGTTEIDLLFCIGDLIYVIEAKNVSNVIGNYNDEFWSFVGSSSSDTESKEYTALSTITQNNIHVRSLKDAYYAIFKEWIKIFSVIIVPNDCRISEDLKNVVHTIDEFNRFLLNMKSDNNSSLHRRIESIISLDNNYILRPDFVFDKNIGCRVKEKR